LAAAARGEAARGLDRVIAETGLQVSEAEREKLEREAVQLVELGRSPAEVSRILAKKLLDEHYSWAEPDPEHLASARYRMPFVSETPVALQLGYRPEGGAGAPGDRRSTPDRNSLVFALPHGSQVVAARAGSVAMAGDRVVVIHGDGTFGGYAQLSGSSVPLGAKVVAGEPLGRSRGGRLSFGVYAMKEGGVADSLRVRFDDGSAEGFQPEAGQAYVGAGAVEAGASP
jgi:murein DD-endopeptidase MepM/ murein hydrolase activator NlpD